MAARNPTPPPSPVEGETPQTCRRCELWERAAQAVLGEGSSKARIMLVGEQPGVAEDREGHPLTIPPLFCVPMRMAPCGYGTLCEGHGSG
jgi:hypothetical protein